MISQNELFNECNHTQAKYRNKDKNLKTIIIKADDSQITKRRK